MARMTKVTINPADRTVAWSFPGTELATITLRADLVSDTNRAYAMLHGLNQRCTDNAADDKTATAKRASILAMVEFYEAGGDAWERTRVAPPKFDSGAVVAALARVKFAGDVDKANRAADAVADKRTITREDALKLFAKDADIAADIARAKAVSRAASAPSAADMLAEIEPTGETSDETHPE